MHLLQYFPSIMGRIGEYINQTPEAKCIWWANDHSDGNSHTHTHLDTGTHHVTLHLCGVHILDSTHELFLSDLVEHTILQTPSCCGKWQDPVLFKNEWYPIAYARVCVVNTSVFSTTWLWWTVLWETHRCRCLHKVVMSFSLGIYPERASLLVV